MKKILSLLLVVVMLFGVLASFASCGQKDAQIAIYLGDQLYDFDPALAFVNDDAVKVMSLIFEPLFTMNAKGKVKEALAESYKIIEDKERDLYQMEITLRETYWSDTTRVTADDIYYAWTRILDPEFESQAAPLLYDIKNAVKVKQGDVSRDEIGLEANVDTITITFEEKIDYDAFLRNLSSIALTPLRENKVSTQEGYWAKKNSYIVTNGPFSIRTMNFSTGEFTLQRNPYYRSATGEADASDVSPSQLVMKWTDENFRNGYDEFECDLDLFLADKLDQFIDQTVFFLGAMPTDKETRQQYAKVIELQDAMSTYTYIFNTQSGLLANENVRKALSMAIDREYLAEQLVYYKAADAFISLGVWESDSYRKTFREEAEKSLINTSANLDAARELLEDVDINNKNNRIRLVVRDTPEEWFIAEHAAEQWGELGFNVILSYVDKDEREFEIGTSKQVLYDDSLQNLYKSGEFDIIGIDYNMYSTNAFTALCGFSSTMNGNGLEIIPPDPDSTDEDEKLEWSYKTHVSGFSDAAYDAIIEEALAEKDLDERAAILHRAEEYLMSKMPIMPILYNTNYYLTDGISGLGVSGYGYVSFTDARLK